MQQFEIRTCVVGLQFHSGHLRGVTAVREPANKSDPLAIAIANEAHVVVGYLNRTIAGFLAPLVDTGKATLQVTGWTDPSVKVSSFPTVYPIILFITCNEGICDSLVTSFVLAGYYVQRIVLERSLTQSPPADILGAAAITSDELEARQCKKQKK